MISFITQSSNERLDKAIATHLGDQFSRSQIKTLIDAGQVTVNGAQAKSAAKVKGGEHISIMLPARAESDQVPPEAIPLTVIYEDAHLAVIDKPAGMTIHPGVHNERGTLLSAMLSRWPEIAEMRVVPKRAGIVHRLDKDTSGLIVIARQDSVRRKLMAQFAAHTIDKIYLALLENTPKQKSGRIDAPLAHNPADSRRMMVSPVGDPAVSEYRVLETFADGRALVRVNLLTGRTHQIRVHFAHIGCPLVGDQVYGFKVQTLGLTRQFLHAVQLRFDHPKTGERMAFECTLPNDLQLVLDKLNDGF